MDTKSWNDVGRKKNVKVCAAFDEIIENDGGTDENLEDDKRSGKLANAVLAEVVALNEAGNWKQARAEYDPAFLPFVPHMDKTDVGLAAVVILGPDSFLVRRGDCTTDGPVLHIDGDNVKELAGVSGFAISRNREWVALATNEGVSVSEGFRGKTARTLAWPEDETIRPDTFTISDDGKSFVFANEAAGIWLGRENSWTKLVPREDVGDDDEPDVLHAAISPDGRYVAYGWQDAAGHYVDEIAGGKLERVGVVGTVSDTPYQLLFMADSKRLLSNTRHMQSGVTVCVDVEKVRGIEDYGEVPECTPHTDDYLRAYGFVLLPGELFGKQEEVAWIGGSGWSHAAPISGGKPVFTQLLGSQLNAMDYDPASKRAAVASQSGVLHVLDPSSVAEPGRERGYKPRTVSTLGAAGEEHVEAELGDVLKFTPGGRVVDGDGGSSTKRVSAQCSCSRRPRRGAGRTATARGRRFALSSTTRIDAEVATAIAARAQLPRTRSCETSYPQIVPVYSIAAPSTETMCTAKGHDQLPCWSLKSRLPLHRSSTCPAAVVTDVQWSEPSSVPSASRQPANAAMRSNDVPSSVRS